MEYRTLGRSSLEVSALCLGTMNFGSRTEDDESVRIIDAAIDHGINFVDTANVYASGHSEEVVGEALSGSKRDKVVLATKASNRLGKWPNEGGSSRYHITHQCEESLRRLKTDRIDLYQLHLMDLSTPLEESMRTMDDLVRQGKVLYVGVSKWAPAWTVEALMLSDRHGWTKIVCEQPPYNLLDRRIENQLIWTCRRHGVGIIPWAPIAAGVLSGKYTGDAKAEGPSRFDGFGSRLTEGALEIVGKLAPLAEEKGCTLAELSLAWVLRQPGITAPIMGPRTMDHLTSSLKALEVEITDADRDRIDEIAPPGSHVTDYWDVNVYKRLRSAAGVTRS